MNSRDSFDICVIGAGVIGLAIAYELAKKYKNQDVSIVILERESSFGQHVSSRNSEVIHAGIYYPTGSLKAELCVAGKELLYSHCEQFGIAHQRIGKLIVAKNTESDALAQLKENAIANGVLDLQLLNKVELQKLEPHIEADIALHSPSTGIIDSHSYMQSLLHLAENLGVQFSPYSRVEKIDTDADAFVVHCQLDENRNPERYSFNCRQLINAAGLEAQSIAQSMSAIPKSTIPKLHYCKGDYFDYRRPNPFSHLIYPMPEANTIGLGIHATMDMSSQLKFGPDTEYVEKVDFEIDDNKTKSFAKSISSYFPAIQAADLKPAYSGIRPKLSGLGEAAADFEIQGESVHGLPGLIQLFGMESPGLTASLAIAVYISNRVEL
ncbi:MAG: NAD(P)/FAD-dependent oxidoreductase [Proteobacteria bacterium]|jgi:L-2-hydroxyglutarate oxidase LhgO|nr:NAD(P)/FAD-dependent oxidoreductase [Pseudomonadota bacterium]MDA1291992.1 NAD(P)/FAD-dependent oxidoreductase [Pseudomonadota bacterium]